MRRRCARYATNPRSRWGDADRTLGAEHFLPLFTALFPSAPIERLAGVGHYCFEDAPDAIAARIAGFIRTTG